MRKFLFFKKKLHHYTRYIQLFEFYGENMEIEKLNEIFSKNIIRLRNSHHLTQFELGEKINYSDKAVSRWERGEAIPDARVLVQLSDIFGITVDDLLKNSEIESTTVLSEEQNKANKKLITSISCIGVWTVAALVFVILHLCNITYWQIFAYALPVSLIVALVFSSLWGTRRSNFLIVSVLVWSIIFCICIALLNFSTWSLLFIGIPAQLLVILGFKIHIHK